MRLLKSVEDVFVCKVCEGDGRNQCGDIEKYMVLGNGECMESVKLFFLSGCYAKL